MLVKKLHAASRSYLFSFCSNCCLVSNKPLLFFVSYITQYWSACLMLFHKVLDFLSTQGQNLVFHAGQQTACGFFEIFLFFAVNIEFLLGFCKSIFRLKNRPWSFGMKKEMLGRDWNWKKEWLAKMITFSCLLIQSIIFGHSVSWQFSHAKPSSLRWLQGMIFLQLLNSDDSFFTWLQQKSVFEISLHLVSETLQHSSY